MRTVVTTSCILLIFCIALCIWSVSYIDEATDELTDLATQLMDDAESNQTERAVETLTIMLNRWERCRPVLEMISDHEDLHRVTERLVEAQVYLKYGDSSDFYQSMALLNEALKHIRDSERFSLANLL